MLRCAERLGLAECGLGVCGVPVPKGSASRSAAVACGIGVCGVPVPKGAASQSAAEAWVCERLTA